MNNTIRRIPRPIGTTELGKQYNNTKDNQVYNKLYEQVIHHYLRNNFTFCGIPMNIEVFSHYIKYPVHLIQKHITSYGRTLNEVHGEMLGQDIGRALTLEILKWGLEDRSRAVQQLNILASSQQGEYKPFISAEVTKAIKLGMDATANLMGLLGKLGTPDLNPKMPNGALIPEGAITADQAVLLLKANNIPTLHQDTKAQERLYLEYDIENMPEVNALNQTGLDTSKEGLGLKDVTRLSDDLIEKEKHTNRRANEFDIDMDYDSV